jgi:hypothetical protein
MQKLDATLLLLQEEYRERLAKIAALPNVVHIEADKSHPLQPNVGVPEINANQVWTATPGSTGAGVIVGIIDTAIDIFHPCFRKANGTPRIRWIWDQSLTPVGTGHAPTGIPGLSPYGVEYTAADINAALSTPKIPFRHADLNSYGTNAVGTSATVGRAPVGRHLRGRHHGGDLVVTDLA